MLCCAADGTKLPPMLIFKERLLKEVKIYVNEKSWMNKEIMISWLQIIWRKRKGASFKPSAFLIMYSMKAHLSENVKE